MQSPDPQDLNFLSKYTAEILTSITVLLLSLIRIVGKKANADAAKEALTSRPVTDYDLLKCKMEVSGMIDGHFEKLRKELLDEIRLIHRRINGMGNTNNSGNDRESPSS